MPAAVEPGAFAPDDLRPEEIPREEERPGSAGGSLSPGIRPVSRQACPTTCLIATRRIAAFHVATGHVTTRRVQPGVQQQAEQFRFLICVWSRDRVDASGKDVTVVGSVHRRKGL